MTSRNPNVLAWLQTHTGHSCTSCGTSYGTCTALVFRRDGRACCNDCAEVDTHHERTRPSKPSS